MRDCFDQAFDELLDVEGGYSNRKYDRGGETRYGITAGVARANGYSGAMSELPMETAKEIYKREYWDALKLDQIATLSRAIAYELFDTAVNMGVTTAGKFLQRALNVLNRDQKDYYDMPVDGVIGPNTLVALNGYVSRRKDEGPQVLYAMLSVLQGARYIDIAERDKTQEYNIYGWFLQRVV